MKLEGIHHITAITGDAPRNVDFYARVLGLRMVKRTVNQDDPTVYHLFYGDDEGSPGNDLTFFEYPGAARGTAGAGMVHRIVWRVGSDAVRAYSRSPSDSAALLSEALGFERVDGGWEARGAARGGRVLYDERDDRGTPGAGTVHHVAWASTPEDHEHWRERVVAAGAHPTAVIDRFYFRSVYFREPSGVLFELATIGPGFAVDEPPESLGEHLSLPPDYEQLRPHLEQTLTQLPDVRQWRRVGEPAER